MRTKHLLFFLIKYVEFIYVVLVQDTVRFACMKEGLPLSVNSSLKYRHLQNEVLSVYQFVTKISHRLNVNGADLEMPV